METEIRDIIAEGTRVKGTIEGREPLLVLGQVEGKIVLQNLLVVGKTARVEAEIFAQAVTVEGAVSGRIVAGDLVAIRAGGRVTGELSTPRLIVEDQAVFDGTIHMEPAEGGPHE
ncbi:MAG: polymer-forming cytoskeletal protein [Deltaproteobacteria bacterium]|nr:polymer-forming cytoskeletal protein [Deltaproteobacteria bacterium]